MCVCVVVTLSPPPSLPLSLSGCLLVDCNDSLYAGDRKLVAEVAKLVHTLLDQVMEYMKGQTTPIEVYITGRPSVSFKSCFFSFIVKEEAISLGTRPVCKVSESPPTIHTILVVYYHVTQVVCTC